MRITGLLFMIATALLAACSGGGGGSTTPPLNSQPPVNDTPPVNQTPTPGPADKISPPSLTSTGPYLLDLATRSLAAAVDAESRRSEVLVYCTVMVRGDDACSLNDLPLIGLETNDPTVDDIMSHAVVTHPWMGTRLRELLGVMPAEIRLMMRGVTGIVISSGINVSFYAPQTGAMYLSGESLWLTEEEEAVLTDEPDDRVASQYRFKWLMLWRYVDGTTDIRSFPRSLVSISRRMTALLFHELAHANDYYNSNDSYALTIPIWQNINPSVISSAQLRSTYPLQSAYMKNFAQVAFFPGSNTATAEQLNSTAADIANEFPNDHANDYYNYATDREDLAMAFEEAMLRYTMGLNRDVAITSIPPSPESCGDYVVEWGQRGRIGDPAVATRSLFAVQRLLPEAADGVAAMLDELPAPGQMLHGVDWCNNIRLGAPSQLSLANPGPIPIDGNVEVLPPWR